jgi:hypothetical protein
MSAYIFASKTQKPSRKHGHIKKLHNLDKVLYNLAVC